MSTRIKAGGKKPIVFQDSAKHSNLLQSQLYKKSRSLLSIMPYRYQWVLKWLFYFFTNLNCCCSGRSFLLFRVHEREPIFPHIKSNYFKNLPEHNFTPHHLSLQ